MIFSRSGAEVGGIVVLAAVYFAAAKLSLLLAIPPGYATAVWPPSGIALAAVLLAGTRIWPGIWLGAALTNLTVQGSPLLAILIAIGNTLEALVGAKLIARYAGGGRFDSGELVVKFVGLSALSAAIAATIGVTTLAIDQALPISDVLVHLWTWWEGDASGMIIVAPLILSWRAAGWPRWSLPKLIEAMALGAALALTAILIFGGVRAEAMPLSLTFLTLPFLIWAAIRFGQREVTIATAMLCAIAIWNTLHGRGPFGEASTNIALLFLLAYACTLVITGLVLSAVIGERDRAIAELRRSQAQLERRIEDRSLELAETNRSLRLELEERIRYEDVLRQSEERFRLLVDGVKDYAIFSLDGEGNITSWNTGARNIKGYAASEVIGTHFSRFYTPEDLARHWPEHELAIARVEGRFEDEGWRVRKDGSRFWANVIITALYDSEHRLRGFAKVTRDLTARRRIEAMQETEQQMREFLAMLAHELRNPLAVIVNAIGVMRNKPGLEQAELRGVIDRQAMHLARIVDDLLDVTRITRGKIALKAEILDLNGVVSRVVESCQPLIDAHRHDVDLRLAGGLVPVVADATRLSQVVLNLISNAVKYTPEGGRITIVVHRKADYAELGVRDSGIGIPAALLPRVFDLFVQGERSLDRTESGLGIGLTLVKRLVELHGGSVEARSDGPGKGSEFIVRLPLRLEQEVAREPCATAETRPAPRRRLLVVDDNRDSANTLAALLETMGHEVRIAYDGAHAVALAAEYRPDGVFLDIGLPGMSGYDVARTLRSSPTVAHTKLIAFTGYGQDEDRQRAREAGFDHLLVKPAGVGDVAKIIDTFPTQS
jgi:PAS domain S-box-containing protein